MKYSILTLLRRHTAGVLPDPDPRNERGRGAGTAGRGRVPVCNSCCSLPLHPQVRKVAVNVKMS